MSQTSIIEKLTKKSASHQTKSVKLKLTADVKLIDDLQFIIDNSKSLIKVDPNVFFVGEVIEPARKQIEAFAQELREKLAQSQQSSSQNNQENQNNSFNGGES